MEDLFDATVTEYENEESIEIPKEIRKIRTQPYDYSVGYIVNLIDNNKIYLAPDFQRYAKVWDDKTASLLIESILLNVPIPPIYVSEEDDGKWVIIDGLQRLTSFRRFIHNEFKLRGMEAFPELNKLNYESLPPKAKSVLNDGALRIILITKESHPEMQYDVFMRLNRGSVKLTEQELRNCLYRGKLNDLIKSLCNNKNLQSILGLSEPHKRMEDAELILRYLAISENYDRNTNSLNDYKSIMKTYLNSFMKNNQNLTDEKIVILREKVENTLEKVFAVFQNNAFRKILEDGAYYKWINKAIFDFIMLSFERYSLDELKAHKSEIVELLKNLPNEDDNFLHAISSGTSEKNNLNYRLNTWLQKMDVIING